MVCQKFSDFSTKEKIMFIGELAHACMSDNDILDMGNALIQIAKTKGLFENVKIMPPVDRIFPDDNN